MPSIATARVGLVIAALMIGIGLYLGVRAAFGVQGAVTGSRGLDVAFAVFFVARGALQVQRWRQTRARIASAQRDAARGGAES